MEWAARHQEAIGTPICEEACRGGGGGGGATGLGGVRSLYTGLVLGEGLTHVCVCAGGKASGRRVPEWDHASCQRVPP
eukprot:CAMPEP_0174325892 /NCGR_PEP_ID=MMETSP0810-20121108/13547_1 /TAXON_ID=73025 ORGANISM="Eutreptiella gymnastica-like, Strain CCMP1594" /NCGR_SAMPLE_ID=MMETSP0810 /ASSEMBLY_ACC=CAM_ASM_000659 /LENGTH=77 /DNA_ID=CAMNT_0015439345 /DNA_START=361 /DNA_END=594 /DNA_ORIENTATION=-